MKTMLPWHGETPRPVRFVVGAWVASIFGACAAQAALPEGYGLSAKYPADRGLEQDAAVLLAEDFEAGDLEDLGKRWSSVSNKDRP